MPSNEMGDRALPQKPGVETRAVAWIIIGFLAFVGVTMAGLFYYLDYFAPGAMKPVRSSQFPLPELQTSPAVDLAAFESAQRAELSTYAWIDRGENIARIPIEEAMRIIAGRGAKGFDPLESSEPMDTGPPGVQQ